jgi:hypothetical protein
MYITVDFEYVLGLYRRRGETEAKKLAEALFGLLDEGGRAAQICLAHCGMQVYGHSGRPN